MHIEESRKTFLDTSSPKVSVVICCYSIERIEDIRRAVHSVIKQTYSSCEVIVAVDHNQELLERLKAELPDSVKMVLNTGVKGLSDTRNAGIQSATGNITAFIDDDATASSDWLGELIQHYREPSVIAVGGKSVPIWINGRPSWFPEELDWIVGSTHKGTPEIVGQVRNLIGCNMSFRTEVFQDAGLFKTELGRTGTSGAGEETEFCMRIRQRMPGSLILYEPGAIVYHKVPPRRAAFKYLISRSFSGGLTAAYISKMYAASSQAPLSTEKRYLRYLLTTALLERVRRLYKLQVIAQTGAIIISIAGTGTGYVVGRLCDLMH